MSYDLSAHRLTTEAVEEPQASLLQPQTILPDQFFTPLRRPDTGERLLLLAILQDAVNCFQRFLLAQKASHRRLFREAERWIMEVGRRAADPEMHPYFSFEQICAVLGFDADWLRSQLQRWQEQQLAARGRVTAFVIDRKPRWVRPGVRCARPAGRVHRRVA
jgi:hypothetical protein